MAETLRVDQASISFWERDKIKPSGSAMVALSALFRTSLDSLEAGTGFVVPDPPSRPPLAKADREFPRSVSLPLFDSDPNRGRGSGGRQFQGQAALGSHDGARGVRQGQPPRVGW